MNEQKLRGEIVFAAVVLSCCFYYAGSCHIVYVFGFDVWCGVVWFSSVSVFDVNISSVESFCSVVRAHTIFAPKKKNSASKKSR
jgi:hypothetical protein